MPVGERKAGSSRSPRSVRQPEEARVVIHLVGGEQPAEQADGDLEHLDRDVLVERQPLEDQPLRVARLRRRAP